MNRSGTGVAHLPDGAQLSFSIQGKPNGHPPILLNRPLGGSMALWGEFGERLATEFQVIAFDPRGVGRSSDVPWLHSTRAMAGDAVALLDFLDIPRAHLFGLSLGGMVATWIAIDFPKRVARLILASTIPRPGAISHRVVKRAYSFLRWFASPGKAAEIGLLRQIVSKEFQRAHQDRMRAIEQLVRATPATRGNLLRLALAAARNDSEPEERRIEAQTLLLFGRLDPIAGHSSQDELLRDLRNSRLEMIEHAGHDLSLEQPIVTADRVIAFLLLPPPF